MLKKCLGQDSGFSLVHISSLVNTDWDVGELAEAGKTEWERSNGERKINNGGK